MKTILSLFDHSGEWSRPYREAGYKVIQVDIKSRCDVFDLTEGLIRAIKPHGVLAAPPCTDFSVSGAQYWPAKDFDGRTKASLDLIDKTLDIIHWAEPAWWALENPVGRLPALRPQLKEFGPWYFQPHWFGDPYTKKTGLWGTFNRDLKRNDADPVRACKQGSWLQVLGGKSERTKELRSKTPAGFARAFFEANP